MTIGPRSQCAACVHMRGFDRDHPSAWGVCFPGGIPDEIYMNDLDHRQPIDGDHGVQFEAKAGDAWPAYAFAPLL